MEKTICAVGEGNTQKRKKMLVLRLGHSLPKDPKCHAKEKPVV
jgi:hypothetical protein